MVKLKSNKVVECDVETVAELPSPFSRFEFSRDGKTLALPCADGFFRLVSVDDDLNVEAIRICNKKRRDDANDGNDERLQEIHSTAWSFDSSMVAVATETGYIACYSYPEKKRFWKIKIPRKASCGKLAFSPTSNILLAACSDRTLRVLDGLTGVLLKTLTEHDGKVPTVKWSPDGDKFASSALDGSIIIWDGPTFNQIQKMSTGSYVWDLAWSPDGKTISSVSDDRTLAIWDPITGSLISSIEGHTESMRQVDFTPDGNYLAARSNTIIRIWRSETWVPVATIETNNPRRLVFPGMAFQPLTSRLFFGDSKQLRVWTPDAPTSGSLSITLKPHRYRNAKIVLVGETGVGKSGLALVLTGQPWAETGSTHGRRVWVLGDDTVDLGAAGKETRETLIWDLAGQPDYRLIHQLHLNEVAVALIVFDSRSLTDPFAGVKHWCRALRQAHAVDGQPIINSNKLLVAARIDVGRVGVSLARIDGIKTDQSIDGYFPTSAKEGWGIPELINGITSSIDWTSLPYVTSTELFHSIKNFLISEKESGRVLSTTDDLYRSYMVSSYRNSPSTNLNEEFDTCIGRMESRGLIQRLNFGSLILLQPELQDAYASAMANAVKDEPDGLGCISEEKARKCKFKIPKSARVRDEKVESLLLISTIEELLRHEIALRETGEDGQYLVFPSQLTRENPNLPDPEGKAVVFTFEGPLMNIYATLAVRLSYSGIFKKKEMWKNAVIYSTRHGGTYGIFLREIEEGAGEMIIFYDALVTEELKFQFEDYVHTHLKRRSLPGTVTRKRIIVCNNCYTPISDVVVRKRLEQGFDSVICNACESADIISLLELPSQPKRKDAGSIVPEIDKAIDAKRAKETATSVIQGKIATNDFDVFLCHNSEDKNDVKRIGEALKSAGVLPWLDEWELQPGLSWQRKLEEHIPRIKSAAVFVGRNGIGPWQQLELEAFLREFVSRDCPVIPVILDAATNKPSLPIFLRGMTWVDFRKSEPNPLRQLIWGVTGERLNF